MSQKNQDIIPVAKSSRLRNQSLSSDAGSSPHLAVSRDCTSANNTPLGSPVMEKKILSRLKGVTKRDKLSDVNVCDDDLDLNSSLWDKNSCPCSQPMTKSSITIECVKCSQKWHSSCANLPGLTQASIKKLVASSWNCPKCFISPYVDQERGQNFKEFLKITSNIAKVNEELKENSQGIEFFNLHLRRLILDEDDYAKDSERILRLETSLAEIKTILSKNISPSPENSRFQVLEDEIKNVKESVAKVTEVLVDIHNKQITQPPLDLDNFVKSADRVTSCISSLERSNASIMDNIESLKESVIQGASVKTESREDSDQRFEALNVVIRDIDSQLKNINQHVCPAVKPVSLKLEDESDSEQDAVLSPAMTPNTTSPHYQPSQSEQTQRPCEPYECYKEDVIPPAIHEKVIKLMDEHAEDFTSVGGSREVLYFGEYSYSYTGTKHEARETPLAIQELLDSIRPHLPNPKSWLNSCLVTRYKGAGSHIPLHRDDEPPIDPESVIVTASLGNQRTLNFINNAGDQQRSLTLQDQSVYVMSRFSQDFWQHEISPLTLESSDAGDETDNSLRYSFTFRHISPHFINSTVLVGDSNTQEVKFGNGVGTLGRWVPGKRIKAAKIEHIPSPQEIGPYRNIVVHTGINNLTNENRPPNRVLVAKLKAKCHDITSVYPKAKVYVSLLLPTKSRLVNKRVSEFNNLILDMAFSLKNVFIIDNSIIGDESGCMPAKYGRYLRNSVPNVNDIVHLGKTGIKMFCMNIKKSIMNRGLNQSRDRYSAGGGNYVEALGRGRRN